MVNNKNTNAIRYTLYAKPAFTLVEAVTALMILAFISANILVVINRYMASAADSTLKMRAFEVTRENMEKLLASDSVQQTVEFGTSDRYPEISWQTVVETFYEPITQRVWVRGICSAEYSDSAGKPQTIELAHWLTDVSKQQLLELLKQQQKEKDQLSAQVFETIEEAAEYASVDVQTVERWLDNGMLTTNDGSFVPVILDQFKQTNGNPPPEWKQQQPEIIAEATKPDREPATQPPDKKPPDTRPDEPKPPQSQTEQTQPTIPRTREIEPITGLPYEELDKMDFWELWKLLTEQKR